MSSTGQNVTVIILLILNIIIAAVYFVINYFVKMKRAKSLLTKSLVMLCCPVIGPAFVGISYLFFIIFFSEPVDLEDVIFSKEHSKFETKVEEDREKNIIPLEEAIAITGKRDLRNLMMNVVSSDISGSLASISLALDSEDSETSHYAASVLQDTLNGFRTEVETCYRKILDNAPRKTEIALYLCDYMVNTLKQKVFIDMEQKYFVDIYDKVAEVCYTENCDAMNSDRMETVFLCLLDIENYERCEVWCDRLVELFPNALAAYTTRMKLYFNCGRREEFFDVVDKLKNSPIVIDGETLEMLRAFS